MRILALFLLVTVLFTPMTMAYQQDQLEGCILGVKQNPIILGVPEESIKDFNKALDIYNQSSNNNISREIIEGAISLHTSHQSA